MTQHKKCEIDGCGNTAKKIIALEIPGREEKLGSWEERKMTGSLQIHIDKRLKRRKLKVCGLCYDTAQPEDFNYTDKKTGKVYGCTSIVRL